MSTNTDLTEKLGALTWPELRKKASQEYGIKLLPEYKQSDLIRLILDKVNGPTKYVVPKELTEEEERFGWSRVKIMKNDSKDYGSHCRACHNGFQFAIPYGVEVPLPTVTAEYIETKTKPKHVEDGMASEIISGIYDGSGLEPRWTVMYAEKNYGPNGETDYIPPSERHKYWNSQREARLEVKRNFYERFNFWPTDKVLKEYMRAGMFDRMRQESKG